MPEKRGELRCICSRRPLLAIYGTGLDGKPYLHIRIYKQRRIYGEVFVSADAEVKIRCRECLRLQKVKIVSDRLMLEEEYKEMEAINSNPPTPSVAPTPRDGIR